MSEPIEAIISEALRAVYDPCCREKGISVVDMGLLRSVAEIDGGAARVELLLTSGWCPFAARVLAEVESAAARAPGRATPDVAIVWDEAWTTDRLSRLAPAASCASFPTRRRPRPADATSRRPPHP